MLLEAQEAERRIWSNFNLYYDHFFPNERFSQGTSAGQCISGTSSSSSSDLHKDSFAQSSVDDIFNSSFTLLSSSSVGSFGSLSERLSSREGSSEYISA
jgi:hypothetical protein